MDTMANQPPLSEASSENIQASERRSRRANVEGRQPGPPSFYVVRQSHIASHSSLQLTLPPDLTVGGNIRGRVPGIMSQLQSQDLTQMSQLESQDLTFLEFNDNPDDYDPMTGHKDLGSTDLRDDAGGLHTATMTNPPPHTNTHTHTHTHTQCART